MHVKRFLYALAVLAASAALYWWFLADWFLPNDGAELAASLRNLVSYSEVRHPIWVKLAEWMPLEGSLAFRTGVISVVFGAFSACLVAYIAAAAWGRVAAFAATAVFLLTPGIFAAATHADPSLVDLTMALMSLAFLARRWRWLVMELICAAASGFIIGAGFSESPVFFLVFLFALIFLVRLDYELWYHALACILLFAGGIVLGFREFTLFFYGTAFYRAVASANAQEFLGWALSTPFFKMMLVAYMPCAIEMFFRFGNRIGVPVRFQDRMGWTVYAIQFMASIAVFAALMPYFSFAGQGAITPALAYVSVAFALCGALAYWQQLFRQGARVDVIADDDTDEERDFKLEQYSIHGLARVYARPIGMVMLWLFPALWSVAIVWTAVSGRLFDRDYGRTAYDYCCEMVRLAGSGRVFVTDGSIEGLADAAAQMERIDNVGFERYNPDSEIVDAIGEGAIDPSRPAIFGRALWMLADSRLRPDVFFYSLLAEGDTVDFTECASKWKDVWSRYGGRLGRVEGSADMAIRHELASQGNFIACGLIESDEADLAAEILREVYGEVAPGNLAAAVNLAELSRLGVGGVNAEFGDECKAAVLTYISDHGGNARLYRRQVALDGRVYQAPDVDEMRRAAYERWQTENPIGIESAKFSKAVEEGDYEQARWAIEAIAELDQSDARSRAISTMMRIDEASKIAEEDERADILDEVYSVDMKDLRLRDGVGGAYYQAVLGQWLLAKGGREYEARMAFRASVTENPRFRAAAQQLLALDIKLMDIVGAREDAAKILRHDIYSPVANLIVGSAYGEAGELDKAEKHLRRAVSGDNPPAVAYNDLAFTLYRAGKYAEAEEYAEIAFKLLPDVESVRKLLDDIRAALASQTGDK